MIRLADIRCACGSSFIVCVDPGDEPKISESSDILVNRGRPVTAHCFACWEPALNFQQTLFGDTP